MGLPEEQLERHYHNRQPFEMQAVSPLPWSDGPWSWASVSSDGAGSAELSVRTAGTDDRRCQSSAVPAEGSGSLKVSPVTLYQQ